MYILGVCKSFFFSASFRFIYIICKMKFNYRLETFARSIPGCSASSFYGYGFSFNNACKSSTFDVRGVPERGRSLTLKSLALKQRNQYLQVLWDTISSPKNRANWFVCFSCVFPLLELVPNAVSNIQLFVAHLVHCRFVRLYLSLNHNKWRFINFDANSSKSQKGRNLFKF